MPLAPLRKKINKQIRIFAIPKAMLQNKYAKTLEDCESIGITFATKNDNIFSSPSTIIEIVNSDESFLYIKKEETIEE